MTTAERRPWRHVLTDRDVTVVGECLRAAADGPFVEEWEFQTLTGVERDEVRALAARWPDVPEDEAYAAVHGVLVNLTGYPLAGWVSADPAYLDDLTWRIHEASGHNDDSRALVRDLLAELPERPPLGLAHDLVGAARRLGVDVPDRLREYVAARPLGAPVTRGQACPPVEPVTLAGRYVTCVPLSPDHADALYESAKDDDAVWDYLSYGPWSGPAEYRDWVAGAAASRDPVFLTVLVAGQPRGVVSYLRMDPPNGVVEIGHIWYAPAIQRTRATTEVAYLLARHVFDDLGYRRLEWKCNALNAASRRAAERFGFTYEGTFRQHLVVKGRNRDTAWYALLDGEWPAVRAAFETWLDPANFDANGTQRTPLTTRAGAAPNA